MGPAFQYIRETAVLVMRHIGVTSENRRRLIQLSENQRLFKLVWKPENGEDSLGNQLAFSRVCANGTFVQKQ